jgi:hypothetical protein
MMFIQNKAWPNQCKGHTFEVCEYWTKTLDTIRTQTNKNACVFMQTFENNGLPVSSMANSASWPFGQAAE